MIGYLPWLGVVIAFWAVSMRLKEMQRQIDGESIFKQNSTWRLAKLERKVNGHEEPFHPWNPEEGEKDDSIRKS